MAASSIEKAAKGAYVVEEVEDADITIISTGSEVSIVLEAAKVLKEQGKKVRVVSAPCLEIFAGKSKCDYNSAFSEMATDHHAFSCYLHPVQDKAYKLSVLPSGAPVMSVEAYNTFGWGQYSHEQFGLPSFGASAPYKQVYEKFDITPKGIATRATKVVDFYKSRNQPVHS